MGGDQYYEDSVQR